MVMTRGRSSGGGKALPAAAEQRLPFPTAAQQEQQLRADRAMISKYRKAWQQPAGVGQRLWRHVCDVLWWLEHVTGVNMIDYEEKVIVVLSFLALLVLIALGAYKQGAQLAGHLQQLVTAGGAP